MDAVIDETDLRRRCMGEEEFVRQMLTIFREYGPKTLQQLHAALDSQDIDAARRFAHTLKGSAGNVSAMPLRAMAFDAEKAIDASDGEKVASLRAALDLAMAACLAEVDRLLAVVPSVAPDAA
jgi:two-component system, sensor histidine kinase and response regulator